jgi:hypothetical protein
MLTAGRLLIAVLIAIAPARFAAAATDATLLRLFLTDGTTLVSYGEYARVEDRVIFSMPIGGTAADPRLYVVSIPASTVDWPRTDRYSASARYQWYAGARAEQDFERVSTEVARVLNEVATSPDRRRALTIAENARRTLAAWPNDHFGYRQADVRDIVSLLDEAISNLRVSLGISEFELAFVAAAADVPLEPVLGMPLPADQLSQLLRVAELTGRASERLALLRAGLAFTDDPNNGMSKGVAAKFRDSLRDQIRAEVAIDARYAALSERMMATASRAAARARIADVERVLLELPREDRRLGQRRPEQVHALRISVESQLEAARQLKLLRDRWVIRRALYRDWQRSVGVQLLRLVKERGSLEAIQRLEGPEPDRLIDVRERLTGGAARLERIGVNAPDELRTANDLLVGAWRFAENAVNARYTAASAGNLTKAWEASSAAAAALIMLERAQQEIRTLLEPPKLR